MSGEERSKALALLAAGVKYRERMGELRPAFEAIAAAAARAAQVLAPLCRWANQPEVRRLVRRREINERKIAQALRHRDQRARRRTARAAS